MPIFLATKEMLIPESSIFFLSALTSAKVSLLSFLFV
nr:MAG TPA: hypothetical protein [Caudoviricetes sp.]